MTDTDNRMMDPAEMDGITPTVEISELNSFSIRRIHRRDLSDLIHRSTALITDKFSSTHTASHIRSPNMRREISETYVWGSLWVSRWPYRGHAS